jgi:hypothetical protein
MPEKSKLGHYLAFCSTVIILNLRYQGRISAKRKPEGVRFPEPDRDD